MVINTSNVNQENFDVNENIKNLREDVRNHLEKAFLTIPIRKSKTSMEEYVNSNPESVIVIEKNDFHIFPIVVDEAKKFSLTHGGSLKFLTFVREHEGEHLGEALSSGLEIGGMALVMFRYKQGVAFGGFVGIKNGETATDSDRLRFLLAPTIPGTTDMLESLKIIAKSKIKERFLM